MAAGSFTIGLDRGTPERIKALSNNAFMQVVVTACRVDADAMSVSDLVGIARYVGVYRSRSEDRCEWRGAGLAVLLGDEDGKGNTYTQDTTPAARPLYDGSNTSVIRNNVLRTGSGGANGLAVGTIASSATPTKKIKIDAGQSPREVLDGAMSTFTTSSSNPYEWRINPAGTLDVAKRNTLFPTTVSPTCLAARGGALDVSASGVDLLPVSDFGQEDDWEDFTTEFTVLYTPPDYEFGVAYEVGDTVVATDGTYYRCNTAHTSSGANLPPGSKWDATDPFGVATLSPVPYDDLGGSDVLMRQVDESRSVRDADTADDVAARKLGRYDDPDRRPSLRTGMFDVGSVCRPGDSIWVFDPDTDLLSLSVQVDGGSGLVFPLACRVRGLEWPVRSGMGVYVVVGGSSGSVTDVSEWVVFDEGDARVDVGQPRRLLLGARRMVVAA